jgi:hypothetical protein
LPAKNIKMVSSKKSAVANKPKLSSLNKVGTVKPKKGAANSLSLSKIKSKSASKPKAAAKTVAKTVSKVASKPAAQTRATAKVTTKVVSRTTPAPKPAPVKPAASTSKSKVAAPVAVVAPAAAQQIVIQPPPVVEPVKEVKEVKEVKVKEPEKKPVHPLRSTTLGALKAFEVAMKAFNRQNFTGAKEAFEQLIARYSAETEIVARVKTYLTICVQRLSPPKALPRNIDELYTQGVIELNRGHIDKAIDLFERALKIEPECDYILYSLAAAQARLGTVNEALANLRHSIELDKSLRSRVKARRDPDFIQLYENREFMEIVGIEVESEPVEQVQEQVSE